MKFLKYIGKMLVLSLVLTVAINLLLFGFRYIPFEIFTEWVWRFELGGTVVIIPWLAMVAISLLLTFFQMIFRRKN